MSEQLRHRERREALRYALGIAIAEARNERGLLQRELGERICAIPNQKTVRAYVARIETGRHEVTLGTLYRYARALEIEASELLARAEELVRAVENEPLAKGA